MTGDQRIVCGLCQTPDTDMHLCPTCTGRLTRLLASCRDALRLAPVTIARQGTARAGEHTRAGNPATGAPVNLAAAQARDQLKQAYVRHATTTDTAALYDWAPARARTRRPADAPAPGAAASASPAPAPGPRSVTRAAAQSMSARCGTGNSPTRRGIRPRRSPSS